ncbi:MAG: hypothetical protein Q8K51_10995 [Nitrospirota bacterium]|nr:hypothetical protein [Nitrospirota bacterium]
MPNITIEVPSSVEKDIPKSKKELTRIFVLGLKHRKAYAALKRFKKLKGVLKEAYPSVTSVELQHRAKNLW